MLPFMNVILRVAVGIGLILLFAAGLYRILPPNAHVDVPFTSQAPEGVWTEPWQNACEEASIIMIDNFYKGDTLTKDKARAEILKIFDIKTETVGPSKDESMETIAAIINTSDLNWNAKVVDNPTVGDIKNELANHRPVIAPVYAPLLENAPYTEGGIDYHVVVITGYDDETGEFITHDPGTQRGEDVRYGYENFYNAINDFLTTKDYTAGPTRVLFTSPKS